MIYFLFVSIGSASQFFCHPALGIQEFVVNKMKCSSYTPFSDYVLLPTTSSFVSLYRSANVTHEFGTELYLRYTVFQSI